MRGNEDVDEVAHRVTVLDVVADPAMGLKLQFVKRKVNHCVHQVHSAGERSRV